jgi:hypothetical protein
MAEDVTAALAREKQRVLRAAEQEIQAVCDKYGVQLVAVGVGVRFR